MGNLEEKKCDFETAMKKYMSKLEKRYIICQQQSLLTPERNRLQNKFLDPAFQNIIIKKCIEERDMQEEYEEINQLYETDLYKKCMSDRKFDLNSRIEVEFNTQPNCHVYLRHQYNTPVISCRFSDIHVAKHHKQIIEETLNLKCMKVKICKDITNMIYLYFVFDYLEISDIYCTIKPILGDEYPSLLLQLNTEQQIQLLDDTVFIEEHCGFDVDKDFFQIVLVEEFNSKYTSKKQLTDIFEMSDIKILFMNDLIYDTV